MIAVLCKSLSVGTDPLPGDERLRPSFSSRFRVTSSVFSLSCGSTEGDGAAEHEFGAKYTACPPEELVESENTGDVALGVKSPESPDGIPKFPATLELLLGWLYIPCDSGNGVGLLATVGLPFLGGGCRETVNVPRDEGERVGVGGVVEPGGVLEELASGPAVDTSGASRSFDIFKSDAGIITGTLADRTLGAGEPCLGTGASGRGSERECGELESVEDLLRSMVRRLVPAALKESSACPGGWERVSEPSTEGERGRVPEKIPFMVVGDGDDEVFILRE